MGLGKFQKNILLQPRKALSGVWSWENKGNEVCYGEMDIAVGRRHQTSVTVASQTRGDDGVELRWSSPRETSPAPRWSRRGSPRLQSPTERQVFGPGRFLPLACPTLKWMMRWEREREREKTHFAALKLKTLHTLSSLNYNVPLSCHDCKNMKTINLYYKSLYEGFCFWQTISVKFEKYLSYSKLFLTGAMGHLTLVNTQSIEMKNTW